jgi:hypothetical protein
MFSARSAFCFSADARTLDKCLVGTQTSGRTLSISLGTLPTLTSKLPPNVFKTSWYAALQTQLSAQELIFCPLLHILNTPLPVTLPPKLSSAPPFLKACLYCKDKRAQPVTLRNSKLLDFVNINLNLSSSNKWSDFTLYIIFPPLPHFSEAFIGPPQPLS